MKQIGFRIKLGIASECKARNCGEAHDQGFIISAPGPLTNFLFEIKKWAVLLMLLYEWVFFSFCCNLSTRFSPGYAFFSVHEGNFQLMTPKLVPWRSRKLQHEYLLNWLCEEHIFLPRQTELNSHIPYLGDHIRFVQHLLHQIFWHLG